jgi:hypothetical protein
MEADMTTLGKTKLTDTQLIARQDGAVSLPDRIKGMAAQKRQASWTGASFAAGRHTRQ